jgi:hypothetical protein
MNDAGEVLLTMYEHVKAATEAAAGTGLAVQDLDAVFGLGVHEYVACSACHLETHSTRYTQYFYNTQVGGQSSPERGHLAWSEAAWSEARASRLLQFRQEAQSMAAWDTYVR